MTGLLLILTEAQGARFEAGIEAAAAAAALGRPVTIFLRDRALTSLATPSMVQAMDMLAELGGDIRVCQTAMARYGITADMLPQAVTAEGLVATLADRAHWQLLLV